MQYSADMRIEVKRARVSGLLSEYPFGLDEYVSIVRV